MGARRARSRPPWCRVRPCYHRGQEVRPTDQDAQWLQAWRGGDQAAGERLFDRHADAVARFFENKVGRGAEDLTQATFLRMIEGRDRMQPGSGFRSFMFGIARNVLREHLRQLVQDRQIDPAVDSVAGLSPGPSTLMGMQQEHRLMLEGLRNLSIDDQILLELFYWEQLKAYEIAEILGQTPSSTRRHLAEARARLDQKMETLAASPEVFDRTSRHFESWVAEVRRELGGG